MAWDDVARRFHLKHFPFKKKNGMHFFCCQPRPAASGLAGRILPAGLLPGSHGQTDICPAAQSKCTGTCHTKLRPFNFSAGQELSARFVRAYADKMHINISQQPFFFKI